LWRIFISGVQGIGRRKFHGINDEITYGCRVTDSWDQRCLKTILKSFSSERILGEGYSYSESVKNLEVKKLPINETNFLINTLLISGSAKSSASTNNNDIALEIIGMITKLIVKSINTDNAGVTLDKKGRPAPLTTVMLQEVESDLEKAIKGFVVMSEALEAVFEAFLIN
jgi:dynein heavy chain, axonemal